MIQAAEVFAQFVDELKPVRGFFYVTDAITTAGVTFFNAARPDLKLGICFPPMMGVKQHEIGFTVTKNTHLYRDSIFAVADPELMGKLEDRIKAWIDGDPEESPYRRSDPCRQVLGLPGGDSSFRVAYSRLMPR